MYIIFTLVSFLRSSTSLNPLNNSLSDLGNSLINPGGAAFYNAGGILFGAILIGFYIGLKTWNTGERTLKVLVLGAQIAGIGSSIGLILSCIYPLGTNTHLHAFWAMTAFGLSTLFWVFSSFALLRVPSSLKWVAYFGYLPLACNIALALASVRFISEWISVGMFLIYVLLLSYETRVISIRGMRIRVKGRHNIRQHNLRRPEGEFTGQDPDTHLP